MLRLVARASRPLLGWLLVSATLLACGGKAADAPQTAAADNPLAKDSLAAQSDAHCAWLNDCNAAAYPNVAQCSLTLQQLKTTEKPIEDGARSVCNQAKIDQCTTDIKASRCPSPGLAAAGSLPNPTSCEGC
jgi:hypothetical protein